VGLRMARPASFGIIDPSSKRFRRSCIPAGRSAPVILRRYREELPLAAVVGEIFNNRVSLKATLPT